MASTTKPRRQLGRPAFAKKYGALARRLDVVLADLQALCEQDPAWASAHEKFMPDLTSGSHALGWMEYFATHYRSPEHRDEAQRREHFEHVAEHGATVAARMEARAWLESHPKTPRAKVA